MTFPQSAHRSEGVFTFIGSLNIALVGINLLIEFFSFSLLGNVARQVSGTKQYQMINLQVGLSTVKTNKKNKFHCSIMLTSCSIQIQSQSKDTALTV